MSDGCLQQPQALRFRIPAFRFWGFRVSGAGFRVSLGYEGAMEVLTGESSRNYLEKRLCKVGLLNTCFC